MAANKTGVTIRRVSETMRALDRTSKRVKSFERRLIERFSLEMVELAKRYAPVDKGNLEESIYRYPQYEGPHLRKVWYVGVDPSKLGESYSVYGHRYDIYQHENIHKPGKATRDKARDIGLPAGGTRANRVGSKYLERAAKQTAKKMAEEVQKKLSGELRGAGWS